MSDFGWDYPPGVTGREPQISGEISAEELQEVVDDCIQSIHDSYERATGLLDDQGAISEEEWKRLDAAQDMLLDELSDIRLKFEPDEEEDYY